jgi:hypothetical protein
MVSATSQWPACIALHELFAPARWFSVTGKARLFVIGFFAG